jgi:hypothetical protein
MTTAAVWETIDSHLGAAAHRKERAEMDALPAMLRDVRHFVDVGAVSLVAGRFFGIPRTSTS